MKIFCFTASLFFVVVAFDRQTGNEIQSLDYEPDIEPYETLPPTERPIFKYQKNGIKLDLKIVPSPNDTVLEDDFPNFPTKDIGACILDLSLTCVQRRFHHFLDKIKRLKEITLLGNWIKLVRTKEPVQEIAERRSLDSKDGMTNVISQDIDSFFDVFALRINLPSIQGQKKKNQIDVMFDETAGLVEGRGKSGKGGKGGGGKCKKMMMMMLMMVKMKMMGMMGMTAMKGMMMAGMSLMISKWMLIQKLMDLKKGGGGGGGGGGPWQGGGGGGGGGAPLKEIVLLTKAAGGGGGGGGGGGDSYGAPPPSSSYGAPSGGWDGGGGSGGGWGRSFDTYTPPSNIISQLIARPGVKEKNKSVDAASSKGVSDLEKRRIGAGAPVYGTYSAVYKANDGNNSLNSSGIKMTPSKSTKNKTDSGDAIPSPLQSQFVTLRSSYQIFPVKDTHNVPAQGNVENPIYVNDWKNFELVKRWRGTQQSSNKPDQGAERSGQDSVDRKYDFVQNQQPYGRLIEDRDIVFHGV